MKLCPALTDIPDRGITVLSSIIDFDLIFVVFTLSFLVTGDQTLIELDCKPQFVNFNSSPDE